MRMQDFRGNYESMGCIISIEKMSISMVLSSFIKSRLCSTRDTLIIYARLSQTHTQRTQIIITVPPSPLDTFIPSSA